jgi:alanyl-tRNA synthetase
MDPQYSIELCGGTHVGSTGEIAQFLLKAEASVAAGVRRIEAVVGEAAQTFVAEAKDKLIKQIQQLEKVNAGMAAAMESKATLANANDSLNMDQLNVLVTQLQNEQKELKKKQESQEALWVNTFAETLSTQFMELNGISFLGTQVNLNSADNLKKLAQQLGSEKNNAVVVLVNNIEEKAAVALYISQELVNSKNWQAPQIIKTTIAPFIKGGGGGQATLASAGGQDASQLDKVIEAVKALIK